uniref:Carboxylesterase type B domain-containing protein n=1 Tax=Panagrolaimus davidi TaxID=227884 RepID=A0A914PKQ5_9BILA
MIIIPALVTFAKPKTMAEFPLFVILCFVATSILKNENSNPIVSTIYGKIEGFHYTTPSGFETEIFLGIPYAAPPIGSLRFEKPLPPTPWTSTLQAKAFGSACATLPKFSPPTASEDCLFMNIIKPATSSPDTNGYPIMLWIHGGGFLVGSSANYPFEETAERIVKNGVIFISINFRQGAFGFFSDVDSDAAGNYGLWDQIQALKFIQKIAKEFDGNPKNVTLFGQSSGAIAVSLLSLSPKTENLFQRTIHMSGSSNQRLELQPKNSNVSLQLANVLGCDSFKNTKNCLKTKTAVELQNGMASVIQYLFEGDGTNTIGFWPRADGELISNISYEKLIQRASKRDVFIGINSQEFYVFALVSPFSNPNAKYFPITPAKAAYFSAQDFTDIVNNVFATKEIFGNKHQKVADKIINFYKNQTHYNSSWNFYLQIYAQLLSDIMFNIRLIREAKMRAEAGENVYYYVYNYVPESMNNDLYEGSGHSRELHNLFGQVFGLPIVPLIGEAATVQKTFVNLFINFAKTGTPSSGTLHVPSVTNSSIPNIQINSISLIQQNLWKDRIEFWDNIAAKYGYDWIENRKL